jgi:transcription-repair coupling factor (superfamily II helicase)
VLRSVLEGLSQANVVGPYPSRSLTLRSVVKAAATGAGLGPAAGRVSGLAPSAQALFVAAALRGEPAVVVVPTDAEVERFTGDLRFFVAVLEGLTDAVVDAAVLPYPSLDVDPYRGLSPHFEVAAARARALSALASGAARVVVASAAALLPRLSAPARVVAHTVRLSRGGESSPTVLGDLLAAAGYTRADPVDLHGEFTVRGGLVDVFPAGAAHPVRVEFAGDTIESIRLYDPGTQRSIATLETTTIVPLRELLPAANPEGGDGLDRSATFLDFVRAAPVPPRLFVSEPADVAAEAEKARAQIERSFVEAEPAGTFPPPAALIANWADLEDWLSSAVAVSELAVEGEGRHVRCQPAVRFHGRVADWVADVARARAQGDTVVVVAGTPGRAARVAELLAEYETAAVVVGDGAGEPPAGAVLVATGRVSGGFRLPDARFRMDAESDVFEEARRAPERRRDLSRAFLAEFRDLKVGDYVVHVEHGIGVFKGLRRLAVGGAEVQEFLELAYQGGDKLYVPVDRLDLVQKYTGGARPVLDRLGGVTWERAKARVRRAMRDMAEELLKLYAARKAVSGHAFSPDTPWQREFEDAFEYELTPDQEAAIADVKRDMEAPIPMDRLLCGDVGYGKTEVAMRAAFKAVMDGKQVAFLAPTTVLAFQHLKTLTERFAGFPVTIELLSRFRSRADARRVLADLAAGKVDIVVGTHRLLSNDVVFRDLGLLIVDEEQRFGVAHKERIKQLKKRVDVLTLTATPIPRTLNMALAGLRDMSVIETPPRDRQAIQTVVVKFDPEVIARAIRQELARGGQVYFVHNRVESIASVARLIQRLVPEARLAVAHGQMSEAALERTMVDFVAHKYDVLLATTIIENGLDIPNANTLIVNRADRYGLAQLYQLRGRVGRSDRRAYAYLLVPPESALSPVARKRLAAIKEFSELGSGFRVAALDLEIRGAGNLLGGEQSGHLEAVGFEMYVKLLEETVRELRGEAIEEERAVRVNLGVDLRIDDQYVPDMNQRLAIYRRFAAARDEHDVEGLLDELRDRYGPVPPSVLNLADYARLRLRAARLGIESLDRQGRAVVLKFRADAPVDPEALVRLVARRKDVTLAPPAVVTLDLDGGDGAGPGARPRGRRREVEPAVSWWTARATEGQVRPGFSRDAVLRPPAVEARGPAGLFARLAGLLGELSEGLRAS